MINADQSKGAVRNIAGKAQAALGQLAGDEEQQSKGAARETLGQVQQAYGDAVEEVTDFVSRRPLAAIAIVAGVSILTTLLMRRK